MDEIPDCGLVVFELLREGERFANEPGNTLTEGVVETLNVAGFAGFLADRFVALGGQDQGIGIPEIRVDEGALPIDRWQGIPQLLSRFCRPVPHGTAHNLTGVFVLSEPNPDLLKLGAHK